MATSDGDDVASFTSFCWPPPPALPLAFPRFLFGLCLFFLACMAKTRLLTSALLFIFYMLFCFFVFVCLRDSDRTKNNKKRRNRGQLYLGRSCIDCFRLVGGYTKQSKAAAATLRSLFGSPGDKKCFGNQIITLFFIDLFCKF